MGRARLWWIPVTLLAVAVPFDVLTPEGYTPEPILAATPAIALGLFGRRGVAWTVVGTLAVEFGVLAYHRFHYDHRLPPFAFVDSLSVVAICVVALGLAELAQRARSHLAAVTLVADTAQSVLLPPAPRAVCGLPVAVRYAAAHSNARIGGDAYAVEDTPFGARFLVADVRGKGLNAIYAVGSLVGAFREAAHHVADLPELAEHLEQVLARTPPLQRTETDVPAESFTTALLAEVPPDHETLRIVNRGHPAPLLLFRREVEVLEPSGYSVPLGMSDLVPEPAAADIVRFPPGALFVAFTDGLVEARDPAGEFLDPAPVLAGRRYAAPVEALNALDKALLKHTGGRLEDDMALLAVFRPVFDRRGGEPWSSAI